MASSTYNPNIPQPTDQISLSQPQILTNFSQLNVLYSNDHVAWNATNTNSRGQHIKITFNAPLSMDPNQVATIASLYTKTVTNTELFFQNGNTSANVFQLTNLVPTSGNDGNSGTYSVFVSPWGLKYFYGKTASINGTKFLTLSGSIFGSTIYTGQATSTGGSVSCGISITASSNSFAIITSGNIQVYWMVVTN